MDETLPIGLYLGEGSSSPMALDTSSGERNLPHRKRSFVQMLMMDNQRDGLDSADLDEMGAAYVPTLLSLKFCHVLAMSPNPCYKKCSTFEKWKLSKNSYQVVFAQKYL